MPTVKVDVWLSVVPETTSHDQLSGVPGLRVAALNEMVVQDLLLGDSGPNPLVGGWSGKQIPVLDGDASQQELYEYIHTQLDTYKAARAAHAACPANDWSKTNANLRIHSGVGREPKQHIYYYKDNVLRWCRYRLDLTLQTSSDPVGVHWSLSRKVTNVNLLATIEASLSVEMA